MSLACAFYYVNLINLKTRGERYYHLYVTDEETDTERWSNSSKFPQPDMDSLERGIHQNPCSALLGAPQGLRGHSESSPSRIRPPGASVQPFHFSFLVLQEEARGLESL